MMGLLDGTQIGENHANLSMILDGARQLVVLLLEIYGVHGHGKRHDRANCLRRKE